MMNIRLARDRYIGNAGGSRSWNVEVSRAWSAFASSSGCVMGKNTVSWIASERLA